MANLSDYLENALANALRGGGAGVTFTAPAAIYVQLHDGAPGEAGTGNVSGETTRVAITFGAAAGGVITSTNAPEWEDWDAGSETLTHITLWDASTSGNCLAWGALATPRAVANDDTFRLPTGNVTLTIE